MRRRGVILSLVLTASLVSVGLIADLSYRRQYPIDIPYEYPVLPGSEAWAGMQTYLAKRLACEVPEEILPKMTTEALVETVIHYPLVTSMYQYNDLQTGYEALKNQFNGLRELERRPDAVNCLKKYRAAAQLSENERTIPGLAAEDLYRLLSAKQKK